MDISFSSSNPFDSKLLQDSKDKVLYTVSSPWPTTLQVRDADGAVVGTYKHRAKGDDVVTFRGRSQRLSEWLPKKTFWSR